LAQQKREEWKRKQRQADGQQKKMWAAALEKERRFFKPGDATLVWFLLLFQILETCKDDPDIINSSPKKPK
jgi:hypothetical protein